MLTQPPLWPSNLLAWEVISNAAPILFNGMGGVNPDAIEYAMNLYELSPIERREIHKKFLAYIAEKRKIAEEEKE